MVRITRIVERLIGLPKVGYTPYKVLNSQKINPYPTIGNATFKNEETPADISVKPLEASNDSERAITTTKLQPIKNKANIGSATGNKLLMVIGGKNEYILECRGVFFWIDAAGGLIKSLKGITSILFFKNIFVPPWSSILPRLKVKALKLPLIRSFQT